MAAATVVYRGTTIWTDASNAGVGGVEDFAYPLLENLDLSKPLPRAFGGIVKLGGRGPRMFVVTFTKQYTNQAAEGTFAAVLDGLRDGLTGTLAVTSHASVTNVRLVEPVGSPTFPFHVAGTTYQCQRWTLIFEKVR